MSTSLPWQVEASSWLAPKTGAMLALAPGLGKTKTAIDAAELRALQKGSPLGVLVVAPLSLLRVWQREVEKWSTLAVSIRVIHKGVITYESRKAGSVAVRWTITNYNTLCPTGKAPSVGKFDVMICDESVLLKNRKTARFKKLKELRKNVGACWLLSGSPRTRFMDDLWSQLNLAITDTRETFKVSSYWRFTQRYCDVHQDQWGWRVVGDKPFAFDMIKKEFSNVLFARSQNDVSDLPEWIEETIECPMGESQWAMYSQMEEDALASLPDGDEVLAPNVLAKLTRLLQIASNPLLVGGVDESGKWDALDEVLEYAPGPTIIWVAYVKTAELLSKRLKAPLLVGATPVAERDRIVADLQAGKLPIVIAHPGVGRFGLTMTAARSAIYLERSFDGDAYVQSMYRIRRIGTVEPPFVYRLLSTPPVGADTRRSVTVDHVVDRVLARKSKGAGETVGVKSSDFKALRNNERELELSYK